MRARTAALAHAAGTLGALAHAAGALAAGARRRAAEDPPGSPYELTAEWLSAVLCRGVPGVRVRSVRLEELSAGTTTRASLEVAYDGPAGAAGLPPRLFVKCTSTLAQRLLLGLGGFIHGEPGFYAAVRPGLEIEAPAGYFAAVDERSWRSIVLIEDVTATRGAVFWRPGSPIDREQIEGLLANMAAWHGALWESPALAGWRWLKTPGEQMRVIDSLIGLANRAPAGARRARAVLPPRLLGRDADLYAGMRRSLQIASRGPRTYLHGDLHVANTYLTREGQIGVADWQTGLRGSWACDYAYLMSTALEVEDRRAWEAELLDLYLERLAAAGGSPPPRGEAWLAYRRATLYPYFAWAYTLGRARWQPAFQPEEVGLMMVERIAAAIDDLESLAAVGL